MYGTDAPVGPYGAELFVAQRSVVGVFYEDLSNASALRISYVYAAYILTLFILM